MKTVRVSAEPASAPAAASRAPIVSPPASLGRPLPTRQHKPGYVALVVVLIVGLGAVGGWLYTQAGAKASVVAVAADVPAGHLITRADLTIVEVAGQVTAIAAGNIGTVVGQPAAVHLLPGMLLQRSMVAAGVQIPAGMVRVGVAVKPGQLPADGLTPGDVVTVLGLPRAVTDETTTAVLASGVQVFSAVPDPAIQGGFLVTLTVTSQVAPAIAAAGNAGLVAMVQEPPT